MKSPTKPRIKPLINRACARPIHLSLALALPALFSATHFALADDDLPTSAPARVGGGGKAFNPDISVNFLTLIQKDTITGSDRTETPHNGIQLQEAELQLFSDVDPYFTANALLSVSQSAGSKDFGIDPEEVFVESTFIPGATFRIGKFKAAFGKHNTLHTHAFPFIDAPLINQTLFGDEGLNDAGVSAAVLIPTNWYTEITAQALGSGNDDFLNSASAGDYLGVGQLKNLWDFSDSTTFEWNLYGARGNNAAGRTSGAFGTDLIFKWRPENGGKYTSLIFSNEYIQGSYNPANPQAIGGYGDRTLGGLASWIQYQFAERWWLQGRVEWEGIRDSENLPTIDKQSALLGFNFSEFSAARVQIDRTAQAVTMPVDEYRLSLQWNITIGAHPAHAY